MKQIKRVAGAGEIQIKTRVLRIQPVVSGVVDPAKTQGGTEMISFGSMIINHVENHFDSGSVETAHHRFELRDLFTHLPAAGVLPVRSKKSNRVVTPVIRQAAIDQDLVVDVRVDWQ